MKGKETFSRVANLKMITSMEQEAQENFDGLKPKGDNF